MSWRLASSLGKLRTQVDAQWPARSKDSDGSIGDERHQNERTSDHNPWVKDGAMGVVTAIDITHDPRHGFDSYAFADMLMRNRDPRIKYVISNRRIGSGNVGPSAWTWRPYHGSNAHDHHVHISVLSDKPHYDNISEWNIGGVPAPTQEIIAAHVVPPSTIRIGASNADVDNLQKLLGCEVTGKYAAQSETEYALRLFQIRHKLPPDGVCGPMTWAALEKAPLL